MTPERWQQIEALFHAAHALPAGERAAFLVASCPNDEALRREVEQLLSQPGSDDGFFAISPVNPFTASGLTAALRGARAGAILGTYRLEALIGVGGMGEVYRAHDGKLGRQVAIKVLPPLFTSDANRLARFEREARTLASLNHPNICAIYGLEEADHVRFLILELVDGDTLGDRLIASRQRPGGSALSEPEALNIARQIARALDYAHRRGIVHRDLKPANVKITSDGAVKVLDFGLAKAVTGDGADADVPRDPARANSTMEGTIVGTPAYMSPEQARGQPIDQRADVWAFGCVLYEMLTGRATFSGATVADTIAAILQREPEWAALPPATPAPIRNLLLGCLAKDSAERLRDIGDVRITIDSVLSGSSPAMPAPRVRPSRPRLARAVWPTVAVLALGIAGVTIWNRRPQPAYSTIELAAGQMFDRSGGAHVITQSHDGSVIAYVASPQLLYLWRLANAEASPIQGTQAYKNVREPAFSPAGDKIVFYNFADQKLTRLSTTGNGSDPVTISPEPIDTPTGIDWSEQGILYGQGRNGIYLVPENGGQPQQIARVGKRQEAHGPQMLPDGDHFLFTIATGTGFDRWDRAEIVVQSRSDPTGKQKPLLLGSDARYVRGGYLVYAVRGQLLAVRFDVNSREVMGSSVPVQDGVSRAGGAFTGAANYSISDEGQLIFVPGPHEQAAMEISFFDPAAKPGVNPITKLKQLLPERYNGIRASPNETRIAYATANAKDKEWRIYTYAVHGQTTPVQLSTAGSNNRYPAWTRDSRYVAFQSDRGEERDEAIWRQAADGSGTPERLTRPEAGESHIPESWAEGPRPGDTTLLYSITKDEHVWLETLAFVNGKADPRGPQPFGTSTSTDPMSATFSNGGDMVAFTKTVGGKTTICVERFPVTKGGDCLPPNKADSPKHPRWSSDDRGLFFDPRIPDFEFVPVLTSPAPHFGDRTPVKEHPFRLAPPGQRTPYDVTAITGRFLGLTTPDQSGYQSASPSMNKINRVIGWTEVLKEKLGR